MIDAAEIYFLAFGILTILGGVVGYVQVGSKASIAAGSIAGVLLIVGACLLPMHAVAGLAVTLILSVLLAGRFVPAFIKTGKAMPAGMMSILSVVGILIAVATWVKR
jgi:uncharacterized membrane protein (UPF0136 family)